MKKGVVIGTIMTVVLGLSVLASAATKIAVVDVTKVVKEYEGYKKATERLEKDLEDTRNQLESEQKKLAKRQNDLGMQKGIVSEKKFTKLRSELEADQQAFVAKYREHQAKLVKMQKSLLENIENDVMKAVEAIAASDKYDLVLDKSAVYHHKGKDITYKVLDRLNK